VFLIFWGGRRKDRTRKKGEEKEKKVPYCLNRRKKELNIFFWFGSFGLVCFWCFAFFGEVILGSGQKGEVRGRQSLGKQKENKEEFFVSTKKGEW